MVRFFAWLVAVAVTVIGCHAPAQDDAGLHQDAGADWSTDCGPNLKPHGPACVPILDSCKEDEVPVPGGGCERVGVALCPGGLAGPPDWACKPVGPPTTCLPGWAKVKEGWCEPVLPKAPCPDGQMEVIGKASCQPVGDCGSGTYGAVKVSGETLFVNQAFEGGDSNGGKDKPYASISAALAAAPKGAKIVIAAGTYNEDLVISQPITIVGRCAKLVTVKGKARVALQIMAGKVVLMGVTITGPGQGVLIAKGVKAQLEDVVVQGCGLDGIVVNAGAMLTISRSLVEDNSFAAVSVYDASLVMDRCVVRETRFSLRQGGAAIRVVGFDAMSQATIQDSVITKNTFVGVWTWDSTTTLVRSVIRDTVPPDAAQAAEYCQHFPLQPPDPDCVPLVQSWAPGVNVQRDKRSALLTLRECMVANCGMYGVSAGSAKLVIERSTIRDTTIRKPSIYGLGAGVAAVGESGYSPALLVKESLVLNNTVANLLIMGADATVERSVIKGSTSKHWVMGNGVIVSRTNGPVVGRTTLVARETLIEQNEGAGVYVGGADVTLERSAVVDTLPLSMNQTLGSGLAVRYDGKLPSTLRMTSCLVARNRASGLSLSDSDAVLARTIIRDTQEQRLFETGGFGIQSSFSGYHRPSLTLRRSVVLGSRSTGMDLGATRAVIERSVIRATRPRRRDDLWGEGVFATVVRDQPTTLDLHDSVIRGSYTTGLLLLSSSATVARSVIQDTAGEKASGNFGDGIEVSQINGTRVGALTLSDSLIQSSARSGLVFFGASGTVKRSVFRQGGFSIVLEQGAAPEIASTNVYEQNQEDRLSVGLNLKSAAGVSLPPPP